MKHPTIFLDQDGTIIKNKNYLNDPNGVEFLENVIGGLKILYDAGFKLVLVTNQSGIARGFVQKENLELIHQRIESELNNFDVKFWKIFFCPHHPDDNCNCRKPKTGMIDEIKDEIDFNKSFMIGDSPADVEFGLNLGVVSIFISKEEKFKEIKAHLVVDDFMKAVDFILKNK